MTRLADFAHRLRALVFRRQAERDMAEEFETHLRYETRARALAGVPEEEARRQALLAFGGVEKWKEATREAHGIAAVDGLGLDLRHSFRTLRRNPGFTLGVVLVLGLGLGAATTVFTVVRTVLWSELPYPEADRLVRVYQQNSPTNRFGLSTVDAQAIASEQRSLAAFGVVQRADVAFSGAGAPERVVVGRATPGFFDALGVGVVAGRGLAAADLRPDAPPVALASWAFADRTFGGEAVGRSVTLDGVPHTVVGVLPRQYDDLAGIGAAVWPALKLAPPTRRGPFWLQGIGRLRPGVTVEDAARDLAGVSQRTWPLWATSFRDQLARLTPYPLRRTIVGDSGAGLGVLAGAVALVLLVAMANMATLMLVRGTARRQELAVRAALGAGRPQLVRLLVMESALLAAGAGALAVAATTGFLRLLQRHASGLPRLSEVRVDGVALLMVLGLAAIAALVMTLPPVSTLLMRRSVNPGGRGGIDPHTSRLRSLLVAAEFMLALPLLFGAGLLLNSFLRLNRVSPGFDASGVVSVNLALPSARYPAPESVQHFLEQVQLRAAELPGIRAVGVTTALPPDDPGDINNFDLLDRPVPQGASEPVASWSAASPGFFETLGVPLLAGRLFEAGDTASTAPVIVVSRSWAERYYRGQSALGRQLYSGGCHTCPPSTVVGVVGDVKYLGLSGSAEAVYEPAGLVVPQRFNLLVRSTVGGDETARALRGLVTALDPELPARPTLLSDRVRDSLADPERWTVLVAGFALAAAGLAAFGIYGLMAYLVRQRQREIGVRLALGARPAQVTRELMRGGMGLALAGSLAGVVLALAGGRWVEGLLFGVSARDPLTLAVVVVLLLFAALASSWIPGRRAARLNLTTALAPGD